MSSSSCTIRFILLVTFISLLPEPRLLRSPRLDLLGTVLQCLQYARFAQFWLNPSIFEAMWDVGPNHIGSVCSLRSVCSPRSACLSCSPRYACLPCSPCSLRLFCLLRPIFDRVWLKLNSNCTIWQPLYNTEKVHTAFNIKQVTVWPNRHVSLAFYCIYDRKNMVEKLQKMVWKTAKSERCYKKVVILQWQSYKICHAKYTLCLWESFTDSELGNERVDEPLWSFHAK